ncbi:MAG TPA: cupredoxin domain-containing protein [Actinomycetota bacterium]|nr:cupredoxin domain-containing protein [Actinomycetota bacterium]
MKRLIYLLLAAAVVTLASCGGGGETTPEAQPEPAEEQTTEAMEEEETEAVDVTGEDETDLEVGDFYFEPGALQGEAGQELTIMIHHEGDAPHTFTSDALGVDESLKPGKEVEVSVTFPDSGSAEFHCEIHPDMTGTIEVAG